MPSILIVGASRGLGLGLAGEIVGRGWEVIGTVRGEARTGLHDLADRHPDRVEVERLDITDPAGIAALRTRLGTRVVDTLFVNAGTTTRDQGATPASIADAEFTHVMLTNALAPMRVIEALADLVPPGGLIGAMSSGQGSIANNERGGREIYRASKAALNMLMRSFAARTADTRRALVLLAPGWIRTDLGGDDAPYSLEESVPVVADVLLSRLGRPGLAYLDRFGEAVPW